MKKYLAHWCFILLMISFNTSLAQENLEKDKAKNSVNKFMSEKDKNYQPLTFGEFFIQTYPKEVQKKLQTKKEVVYSIVHIFNW